MDKTWYHDYAVSEVAGAVHRKHIYQSPDGSWEILHREQEDGSLDGDFKVYHRRTGTHVRSLESLKEAQAFVEGLTHG